MQLSSLHRAILPLLVITLSSHSLTALSKQTPPAGQPAGSDKRPYVHEPFLYVNSTLLWKSPRGSFDRNLSSALSEVQRTQMYSPVELSSALCSVGDLYIDNHDYDKALSTFIEAGRVIQNQQPKGSPDEAAVKHNMAVALQGQHGYEMAEHLYQEAIQLFNNAGNRAAVSEELENLGEFYYQQHRLAEAEAALKQSMQVRDASGDRSSSNALNTMQELTTVLEEEGKPQEATMLIVRQGVLKSQLKSFGIDKVPPGFGTTAQVKKGKKTKKGSL